MVVGLWAYFERKVQSSETLRL